jgi:hypothetical protein
MGGLTGSILVHIRYYDRKHSTVIAKYTIDEIEKSWDPYGIWEKTSPVDMVWLVSKALLNAHTKILLKFTRQTSNNVKIWMCVNMQDLMT